MSSNANLSFIDTCWFSLEIVGFHWVFIKLTMKKPSLVMMRECPCSTKTREGLENPSPPPSRFPWAMGFAPLNPRDFPRASPSGNPSGLGVQNPWPREISQDFPRPSRFPSGFALGKSLGSREIFRASGMDFPIPPSSWWSTDTILPCWQGCTLNPSL